MSKERCSTCMYLFPIKELVNGKWLYGNCCVLFPVTEPDDEYSFAMFIKYPEKDHCEMYKERNGKQEERAD